MPWWMPPRSVLGTLRPSKSSGCAVALLAWLETVSGARMVTAWGVAGAKNAIARRMASRSPNQRSLTMSATLEPVLAGEVMMWLLVSNAAAGPGYAGV